MQQRPSVLIIEPRPDIRIFLEMTLSREEMRVFSAPDLGSALLQLRVLQPDLIIICGTQETLEERNAVDRIKALSPSPVLTLGRGDAAKPGAGVAAALPYPLGAGQLCAAILELLGA